MVTLIGFTCILINYFQMHFYLPTMVGEAPRYVYVCCALGMFIYQTLDAMDGKHARRTNSSSPLGELFDHGCDALNCTISALTLASTLQLGTTWWTFMLVFFGLFPFWFSTWEEYHTGILFLGIINGPTEGLFLIQVVHLVTAFTGPNIWLANIKTVLGLGHIAWLPSLQINHFIVYFSAPSVLGTFFWSTKTVLAELRTRSRHRLGRDVATSIYLLFPLFALLFFSSSWAIIAPEVLTEHAREFLLIVCFVFGKLCGRLILARLTSQRYEPRDLVLAPYLLCLFNATLPHILKVSKPLIPNQVMIYAYLAFSLVHYLQVSYCVITEITAILNIKCFSIPYPRD
eukprot:TRINITY_DN18893_c0_g1_i1.p1 TRINITY_DN18893_c0_g1~~TRINITY_DN18893_c0_g1_i1.p1  ORF type:complete len:398 (-),score=46.47 TRINITY_DN18893_c0_g1_i1:145-1176(-)